MHRHPQPHHSEWLNRLPFDTFLRTGLLASGAAQVLCGLATALRLCPVAVSGSAPQLLGDTVDPGTGAHNAVRHNAVRHGRSSAKHRASNPSLGQRAARPPRRVAVHHRSYSWFVATSWNDAEKRWH